MFDVEDQPFEFPRLLAGATMLMFRELTADISISEHVWREAVYGPRVWAEIRLGAIAHNVAVLRSVLRPRVKMMGVIKADAYGHGAVPVARCLIEAGVDRLGVGDSSEAIELRRAGILAPISILGATVEREIDEVVFHGVTPMIHSVERVALLDERARRQHRILPVHVMVDTGMGRLGVHSESLPGVVQAVAESRNLYLEGLASHFSTAGEEGGAPFLERQLRIFQDSARDLRRRGHCVPLCHLANSAALLHSSRTHGEMVRPGIALYGISAGASDAERKLRPALCLKTQIAYIKEVDAGFSVSYGRAWTARRRSRIATLPIGYNDGFLPQLAGRAEVLVRGHRAPVVGRITMDYTMVDVTGIPDLSVYDEVVLVGSSGDECIRAIDLARWGGVPPYAISCGLGKRVERIYMDREPLPARSNPWRFVSEALGA